MLRECVVYSTSRAIREAVSQKEEGFLPDYITMGEFLERSLLFENKISPDQDLRLLAMHEACRFDSFSALKIERNFFSFIHHSEYIFRLFEELSAEQVSIESLLSSDIYGEYEEHLQILNEVLRRYRNKVEEYGWKDPIFSKQGFVLNPSYVKKYNRINVHIDGYLSRFELDLLVQISQLTEVRCTIPLSPYNTKMKERFEAIGIELSVMHLNIIDLHMREVVSTVPLNGIGEIVCESVSQRLEQIGYIQVKVAQMVSSGISPDRIVVVVPDESFVPYMEKLNPMGNLNFAMGKTLREESVIKMVEAIERYLDEPSSENQSRLLRIPSQLIEWVRTSYSQKFVSGMMEQLYYHLKAYCNNDDVKTILQEEYEKFKTLWGAMEGMEFRSVMKIFLNRIKNRTLDDIGGGKVTVMGVLETRGIEYEGVIVIDFNESHVPRKSQKDMFLNTQTRKMAGLPTPQDRESLQKHYYWMLFSKAKAVSLCCVANNENVPSRFLMQMGISIRPGEYDYSRALFEKRERLAAAEQIFEGEYDFTLHTLSASSLKSFLTCKREFYYKYILKLKEHKMEQDLYEEREMGNKIHAALQKLYTLQNSYQSSQQIREAFEGLMKSGSDSDVMERYLNAFWIEKMELFYQNEAERFAQGVKVAHCEKELSVECEGITLIGRIDRIDHTSEGWEVIDYKSGKYPSTTAEPKDEDTDYQLSVYALLAQNLGQVKGCGYYDLNRGVIDFESYLNPKVEKLREILGSMASQKHWHWEQCEDFSACRYCTYAIMCQREL